MTNSAAILGAVAEALRPVIREELERALRPRLPDLLTTEQAAEVAGVTPKTIRAWIAQGLPAERRGRRRLISRAALDAWTSTGGGRETPALLSSLAGRTG